MIGVSVSELSYSQTISFLRDLSTRGCSSCMKSIFGVHCGFGKNPSNCPVRQMIGSTNCNPYYQRMVASKLLNELDTDQLLK